MNMFKPDEPTISESKKERLLECNYQLNDALDDMYFKLDNHDFDKDQWKEIDKLMMKCFNRSKDIEEEIKNS